MGNGNAMSHMDVTASLHQH